MKKKQIFVMVGFLTIVVSATLPLLESSMHDYVNFETQLNEDDIYTTYISSNEKIENIKILLEPNSSYAITMFVLDPQELETDQAVREYIRELDFSEGSPEVESYFSTTDDIEFPISDYDSDAQGFYLALFAQEDALVEVSMYIYPQSSASSYLPFYIIVLVGTVIIGIGTFTINSEDKN